MFVIVYLDYTTQTLQEEELALSVYFLQNVTRVDNTAITLDFVKEKMIFQSTLYVEGNGILMKSNSKGFQNNDSNCKENLDIVSKDGSKRGRTWHDRLPISFEGFGQVGSSNQKIQRLSFTAGWIVLDCFINFCNGIYSNSFPVIYEYA